MIGLSIAEIPECRMDTGISSCFDAATPISYTGRNRASRAASCVTTHLEETGISAPGRATDCYHKKESGVDNKQDDPYAARRATLVARFQALPQAGSDDYWRSIEPPDAGQELPPEVLARCFRERDAAGAFQDTERIFIAIMRQIEAGIGRWAWSVARQAKSGMVSDRREELEQECYAKLWEELKDDSPTFLLENFDHALDYLCGHVAHSVMQKAGEWKRRGVEKPRRVPQDEMESIHAEPDGEDEAPLSDRLASTSAQNELDLAEYCDLLGEVETLPPDERAIIEGLFYDGRTQEEVAALLGVTARTIRNRLKKILHDLLQRYQGSEEDDNV